MIGWLPRLLRWLPRNVGGIWPNGTPVTAATTPNTFSIFKMLDNGSNWLAQADGLNYTIPCTTNCNQALQFDGSQNYATVPNDAAFFPETGTVEFWMKGLAGQSSPPLLYGWGNPDYGWAFCSDGAQITLYFATAGGIQGLTTTQTPFDSTWHHIAAVWSAGTVSFFVDGCGDVEDRACPS